MHTTHFYFSLKTSIFQVQGLCIWSILHNFLGSDCDFINKKVNVSCPPAVNVQKTAHTLSCGGLFWEESLHSITISQVSRGPQALLLCLPPVSRAADCLVNSLISYRSPSNAQTNRKHPLWQGLCSPSSPRLNHPLLNHRSSFITQIKRHRPASPA